MTIAFLPHALCPMLKRRGTSTTYEGMKLLAAGDEIGIKSAIAKTVPIKYKV